MAKAKQGLNTLTGAATDDTLAGAATPLDDTLAGEATPLDDTLAGEATPLGDALAEAEEIVQGAVTAAEQSFQDTLDGATQDPDAVTTIDPIAIKGWMDIIEAAKFGPFDALRAELERCGMDLRAEGPYHICELAGVRSSTLGDARSAVFAWTNAARRALSGVSL